jgi:hypothetical protein
MTLFNSSQKNIKTHSDVSQGSLRIHSTTTRLDMHLQTLLAVLACFVAQTWCAHSILKICTQADLAGECSQTDGGAGECRGITTTPLQSASLTPAGSVMFFSEVNCDAHCELESFDLSESGQNFETPLYAKSVMFL